jgi:hypothetical protein
MENRDGDVERLYNRTVSTTSENLKHYYKLSIHYFLTVSKGKKPSHGPISNTEIPS